MLGSSSSDYQLMHRMLKDQPDLAHRRDFINGVSFFSFITFSLNIGDAGKVNTRFLPVKV